MNNREAIVAKLVLSLTRLSSRWVDVRHFVFNQPPLTVLFVVSSWSAKEIPLCALKATNTRPDGLLLPP